MQVEEGPVRTGLRELKKQEATFNKFIRSHNALKKEKEKARNSFSPEPLEGPGPGHLDLRPVWLKPQTSHLCIINGCFLS